MEKIIHVKGHWCIIRGKKVYRKAYSYSKTIKEPRIVNGLSTSHKHNKMTITQLRNIAMYSDRQSEDYFNMQMQYPEVFKLVEEGKIPDVKKMPEKLRLAIEHVHNVLY